MNSVNDADRAILDHFTHIRGKTIVMLRAVDEDLLDQTPDGEQYPLKWGFAHIASGVDWWMQHVMDDGLGFSDNYPSDKDDILDQLTASRDRLVSFFTSDDGEPMARFYALSEEKEPEDGLSEWVGRDRVLYLTGHELHHLGRIELALWQFGATDLPDFP
jgi:hypothetical protein